MTIVEFLEARLAEDEAVARAASPGPWTLDHDDYPESITTPDAHGYVVSGGRWGGEASVFDRDEDAHHIARHDPARVLRDVEAHRAILAEDGHYGGYADGITTAIYLLAAVYADHPDFDPAWAVTT